MMVDFQKTIYHFFGKYAESCTKNITTAVGGTGLVGILVRAFAEEQIRVNNKVARGFQQYTDSVGTKFEKLEAAKKCKDSPREDTIIFIN